MAEHVQEALDEMVAPLRDLQEREVFSVAEIHAIVARRRDSEYALRRRIPRKADFLRYIQAEMDLERLRKLRVKRLRREQREQRQGEEDGGSKRIGDKHILQHTHSLWGRTLRKYGSDVSLYLQYAEFCKTSKSSRRLSRLYAEALQMHPKVTGLWIEAASHEYFEAGSVQNARILLQRALRVNHTAQDLWLQSFGLELHFCQKMQARRKVLLGKDEENVIQSSHDGSSKYDNPSETESLTTDGGTGLAIASLIFKNAVEAIPNSVEFRLQFLDQCRLFPATGSLEKEVILSIEEDCQQKPAAWIARATYMLDTEKDKEKKAHGFIRSDEVGDNSESEQGKSDSEEESLPAKKRQCIDALAAEQARLSSALDVLIEAMRVIPTEEMYLQTIQFVHTTFSGQYDDEENGDPKERKEELLLQSRRNFLDSLFKKVSTMENIYSSRLALEYANHLRFNGDDTDAVAILQAFVEKNLALKNDNGKVKHIPAAIWTTWAALVFDKSPASAVSILQRALVSIPMNQINHLIILLQLLGAKLQQNAATATNYEKEEEMLVDASKVFERILLLAPGFGDMEDVEDAPFGVKSVPDAFLVYLRHVLNTRGIVGAREVYNAVLFQSTFTEKINSSEHMQTLRAFVDESIEANYNHISKGKGIEIRRLYDAAVKLFSGTPLADEYRQRRDDNIRYGFNLPDPNNALSVRCAAEHSNLPPIPSFNVSSTDFAPADFLDAFRTFKIVHLKNAGNSERNCISWKEIGKIFQELDTSDKSSWCIETEGGAGKPSANNFLKGSLTTTRAYCSFLVQNDKVAFEEIAGRLPLRKLEWTQWSYERALWFFFGRNPIQNDDLQGRPEHTDSIQHDGTWHFQLSGTKKWFVRPTRKLLEHLSQHLSATERMHWKDTTRLHLNCNKGDVIVINTRLWFHQTVIPSQRQPSVSYARDFVMKNSPNCLNTNTNTGGMTNVDGLYATDDISSGAIIFKETDMPDCELHRSSVNPNCEVVELDDGTNAVVSSRHIAAGEFFCVAESSSDEDSEC